MKSFRLAFLVAGFMLGSDVCAQLTTPALSASIRLISADSTMSAVRRADDVSLTNLSKTQADAPVYFRDREYYLRKSRRQKRTGWILLGTGAALITTGIIVAATQDDDPIANAASLLFISTPGLVTSLISIPFFTAAAKNKRKANSLRSSVGLLKTPALPQQALQQIVYPVLTISYQL